MAYNNSGVANLATQNDSENAKPLTRWANEPTVADLKQDYTDAQQNHQKQTTQVETWLSNLEGDPKFKAKKGKSKVVPKVIRKQAEWRYAALSEPFLSTPDLFRVSPVTFEDKESAEQNQLVLNNQVKTKLNKTKFIDEYVRTATDEGTVILKTGWVYEAEEYEVTEPKFEMQPVLDNERALAMIDAGQEPLEAIQIGMHTVTKTKVILNHPSVDVCKHIDTVIDPTCEGDVEKAQFIIWSFDTTYSNLKKDERYQNIEKILKDNQDPLLAQSDADADVNFTFKDEARKKCRVFEYWGFYDIDNSGIVTPFMAAWVGDVMVRMELNPFKHQMLPFDIIQYLPVRKKIYGQPDGYLLEDNQDIVGAVTRGMIDIMGRSANGQQGVRKDALDVANSRRFEHGEDYKFNSNVDPRQAFHMGTYPEIPNSAMLMITHENNEAEGLTGVKAYSSGITGASLGSNVGNARGALDAASKRELGILRRLAEGLTRVGRKIISMNSEFLEDEEVIRITNDEFVPVRRDDLAGDFDLELTIATAEADNQKAEELSFMLQTMGQTLPFEMSQMILADITKLRKMPTLAKSIEEFKPEPDPLAQEEAKLKVDLLRAQVFNEEAKGAENYVDVDLKTAKIRTEEGKAAQFNATADKQDLDFVEQQSGTSHARAKDLKDNEKANDLDLKAADHMLKKDLEKEPSDVSQKAPQEAPQDVDTSFMNNFDI